MIYWLTRRYWVHKEARIILGKLEYIRRTKEEKLRTRAAIREIRRDKWMGSAETEPKS